MNFDAHLMEEFRILFAPPLIDIKDRVDAAFSRLNEAYADAEEKLRNLFKPEYDLDDSKEPTIINSPKPSRTKKKKKLQPKPQSIQEWDTANATRPASRRCQRRAAIEASEKITFGYDISKVGTKLRRDSNYCLVVTKKKNQRSTGITSDDTYVTAESANFTSNFRNSELIKDDSGITNTSKTSLTYVQDDESQESVGEVADSPALDPRKSDQTNKVGQYASVVLEDITNRQVSLGISVEVSDVSIKKLKCDSVEKDQLDSVGVVAEISDKHCENPCENTVTLHQHTSLNVSESLKVSPEDDLHGNKYDSNHLSSTARKFSVQSKMFKGSINLSPVVSLERLSTESFKSANVTPEITNDPATPYSVKEKIDYFNKKAVTSVKEAEFSVSKGKSVKVKELMSETQLKKLNKRSISSGFISKHDISHVITKAKLTNILKSYSDRSAVQKQCSSSGGGLSRTLENSKMNKPKYMNLLSDTKTLIVRKPILTASSINAPKTDKFEERLKREEEARKRKEVLMERRKLELKEKNEKRCKQAQEHKLAVEKEHKRQIEKLKKADHQKHLKAKEIVKNCQLLKMPAEVKTPKAPKSGKKHCKPDPVNGTYIHSEDDRGDVYDMTIVPNTDEPDGRKDVAKWSKSSQVAELVKRNINIDYREIFGKVAKQVDLHPMFGKKQMRGRTSSAVWGLSPYRA